MRFCHSILTLACPIGYASAWVIDPEASVNGHAIEVRSGGSGRVLPPSQDPWYTAPNGFEKKAPGEVLRFREAQGNLTAIVGANCSAAYNIMYRTTDSLYKPAWAVTTVFVPKLRTSALLSYQIPYDSAWVDASPSYQFYKPTGLSGDIVKSLAKGWFVNVPDYEGPLAAFTAGVLSGHSTIDSVRAVLNSGGKICLPNDARYAMWGYSGGALASAWAAELQVQYAPEMNFSGAALGGLTPNVTSVLLTANGGYAAALIPAGLMGIVAQFPEIKSYLLSRLKPDGPYNATTFLSTLNMTLTQAGTLFAFQDITQYFKGGLADILNPTTIKLANNDGMMGYHGVPTMPLFAYKAIADRQSAIPDTDELVKRFCEVGANILYTRNSVGGHAAESTNSRPAAEAWLASVLNGTYAQIYETNGCTVRNVTLNITNSPL